ncbi:MAG: universal stress protein [Actinomycetota bacterium]|nr:universal stress protein [Actinomycetota bacterium]
MSAEGTSERVIVVGVDGSKSSSGALSWAAGEARLRGTTLKVVRAWRVPVLAYGPYVSPPPLSDFKKSAEALLDEQVKTVLGGDPGVTVVREVAEGPAAEVIVAASAGAEMVVVGSRGLGGFAGLLLGSVGAQVAHHAHCPVTIWRSGQEGGTAG